MIRPLRSEDLAWLGRHLLDAKDRSSLRLRGCLCGVVACPKPATRGLAGEQWSLCDDHAAEVEKFAAAPPAAQGATS